MDSNTLLTQAQAAIRSKRLDEARKLLIEAARLNPRNEEAWMTLASIVTDMDQAIDCLHRVLALNPQNATAREWLNFARQERARQGAVAEMKEDAPTPAEVLLDEPEDGERPVPRLGRYLLDYRFITADQLKAALLAQRKAAEGGLSRRLGDILLEQGAISEERLSFAVREQHRSFYSLFND